MFMCQQEESDYATEYEEDGMDTVREEEGEEEDEEEAETQRTSLLENGDKWDLHISKCTHTTFYMRP